VEQELLFNPDGPALSVLPATPSAVYDLMGAWIPAHPEWDILRVGGERSKSIDKPRFMNEVSAALQFPYYFGHNWDAFRQCVNDLSWLNVASFLIVFDSAQHLLSESDDDFEILLRILAETHDEWRAVTTDFGTRGKLPIAFQSVLACQPEAVEALEQRMNSVNARFTRL
jgi:Barstar (barnase inhibitor)